MPENNLLTLPPDLYSRNTIIAYLIGKLLDRTDYRVLDVGGKDSRLHEFLSAESRYVLLDKLPAKPPFNFTYIVADARKIPFSDKNFDVVVASDMLEHVEQIDREKVLDEMLRVSKKYLILGAPFMNSLVERAENYVREQYLQNSGAEHPFLIEHDRYGLPDEEKTDAMLAAKGLNFIKINEGNLMNWYIQQLYTGTHYGEDMGNGFSKFSRYYNEHLNELGGLREPTYRIIYVISKEEAPSKAEILTDLHARHTWKAETFMELLKIAFDDLRKLTERKKHDIKVLKGEVESRKNELAAFKTKSEETLEIARKSVDAHRHAIIELRNFLGEKERTLQYIKQVLLDKAEQLETLAKEKNEILAQADQLSQTIKQYKEYYAIVSEENFALKIQNENLKQELEAKAEEIKAGAAELEAVKTDLASHSRELLKVINSRAWKLITAYGKVKQALVIKPWRMLKKGFGILFGLGIKTFWQRLSAKFKKTFFRNKAANPYELFYRKSRLDEKSILEIKARIKNFSYQPTVSIAMPVYNIEEKLLNKAIESVKKQLYPKWELCLCDDASTDLSLKETLSRHAREDKRIKVTFRKERGGIAAATNGAVKMASGAYVCFMDDDDELAETALFEVVGALQENKYDLIYSDEDKIDAKGKYCEPFFKPDWSPDLLLSNNYICHLAVYRRKLLDDLQGMRTGFDGSQDYDLVLRATEITANIKHIPKVLYHWRKVKGSTAGDINAKPYALTAAKKALEEAIKRRKIYAEIQEGKWTGSFRARRGLQKKPLISIIVPFHDKADLLQRCVESVLAKSTYPNYELLLVDNNSRDPETKKYLQQAERDERVRLVNYDLPFNFSALNNWAAASQAAGEILVLLNNDTEVISPDWLENMLEHALRPEVGAVGAKLIYPNNSIQHAGVIIGLNGIANHAFNRVQSDDNGYFGQLNVVRNYSAVTGACMMIRKDLYLEMGGLDENNLRVAFNDVDLCLRLRQKGCLIVYTPYAELYHHESASRGFEVSIDEIAYMQKKYGELITHGDPYYNPNLSRERFDFSLRVMDRN